jgi:outer membrane lipoprotein SlyB
MIFVSLCFLRCCFCNFKQKMARPHHRKKHKQHLQQFKHNQEITKTVRVKSKASGVFAFAGAVVGLLLGYFAGNSTIIWAAVGMIVGGVAGYLVGRRIDGSAGS